MRWFVATLNGSSVIRYATDRGDETHSLTKLFSSMAMQTFHGCDTSVASAMSKTVFQDGKNDDVQ